MNRQPDGQFIEKTAVDIRASADADAGPPVLSLPVAGGEPGGEGGLVRRSFLKVLGVSIVGAAPLLRQSMALGQPAVARPRSAAAAKAGAKARGGPAFELPASFQKRFPANKLPAVGKIPPMSGALEVATVSVVGEREPQGGLSLVAPGRQSAIVAEVRTQGSGRMSVPWRIEIDGKPYRSGVKKVEAGNQFQIRVPWKPKAGNHRIAVIVDPDDKYAEPSALPVGKAAIERASIGTRRVVPITVDNWGNWSEQFKDALSHAVEMWKLQAHFQNMQIMGVTAIGSPGCFTGPDLTPYIKQAPQASGIPAAVLDALARAVAGNFRQWQDSVAVPGLPWYPYFAAFPGPFAPPMPNIPMPLICCISNQSSAITSPDRLRDSMSAALGSAGESEAARAAVQSLSTSLALGFVTWMSAANVMMVMGLGPVPSYAPPHVPVGAVINGWIIPSPGHMATSPGVNFFNV